MTDAPETKSKEAEAAALKSRVEAIVQCAREKKADEPVALEVGPLTSYADYFVIAGAPSERQAAAVAAHIEDEMRRAGHKPLSVEGKEGKNWVLIDFGDVIVHLFLDSARDYYDLEGFWSDAPRLDVSEEQGEASLKALRKEAEERAQARVA